VNLINAIRPIIGSKTAKVALEVSANPKVEGEMVVVARPVVGPVANNASEELKQLCAALATPIKVIGTPDVIEKELAAAVSEQAGHRSSWDARAAELDALIASGAKADAKKSGGKASEKKEAGAAASEPKAETPEPEPEKAENASETPTKPFSL
jgi:PRTRC genetic system protein E